MRLQTKQPRLPGILIAMSLLASLLTLSGCMFAAGAAAGAGAGYIVGHETADHHDEHHHD